MTVKAHSDQSYNIAKNRPRSFPRIVCEHLAVLLAYSDEELVDRHGRVYGHFATEESFDVMGLTSS